MSCFSCFSGTEKKKKEQQTRSKSLDPTTPPRPPPRSHVHPDNQPQDIKTQSQPIKGSDINKQSGQPIKGSDINKQSGQPIKGSDINKQSGCTAQTFTFRELAAATKNFRQECLVGEGGFGRVYKGVLERTGQTVAVKQLDRNGLQGNKEFLVEVLMLSHLNHENLVNLIGYCADGDQRLLVYEFMPLGSVEDHLLDISPNQKPLDWCTRMKIGYHAIKGLEYLHTTANPPVIYRDMKTSNILIDQDYNAKISDFGLAKLGPVGDKSHVSSRIMGTYGYCAPEYQRTGQLTLKTDVYSFGVVFLELITGKRAIDITLRGEDQLLVNRVEPIFRDQNRYPELADPLLNGDYPRKSLNQAVAVAAMCLHEDPSCRPFTSDIVTALSYLWVNEAEGSPVSSIGISNEDDMEHEQDELTAQEREEAVAEAIQWCSASKDQSNNTNFTPERQNL